MNKFKRIIPITAALLLATSAAANTDKVIKIYATDTNKAPTEFSLSDVRKITFASDGFDVTLNGEEASITSFKFDAVNKLTFADATSVENILNDAKHVRVAPNPVRDYLHITGSDLLIGKELSIYSVAGQNILNLSNWDGKDIDVSHLSKGIYIVNINSTTLKFVKL